MDNGEFLKSNYTKEEYQIEREFAIKKFDLALRQRTLKNRLKRKKIKSKWGYKTVEKPKVSEEEIWKERMAIARGLKEIQVYENEKMKKKIPQVIVDQLKERMNERFGNLKIMIYPDGFRHLEDFNTYKSLFPTNTLDDYLCESKS